MDEDDLMDLNEENLTSLRAKFAEEIENLQSSVTETSSSMGSSKSEDDNNNNLAKEIFLAVSQSSELLKELDRAIEVFRDVMVCRRNMTIEEIRSFRYFGFRVPDPITVAVTPSHSNTHVFRPAPSPQYTSVALADNNHRHHHHHHHHDAQSRVHSTSPLMDESETDIDDIARQMRRRRRTPEGEISASSSRQASPQPIVLASTTMTATAAPMVVPSSQIELEIQRRVEKVKMDMHNELEKRLEVSLSSQIEKVLGERMKYHDEAAIEARVQSRVQELLSGELSGVMSAKMNQKIVEKVEEQKALLKKEYEAKLVAWQRSQQSRSEHAELFEKQLKEEKQRNAELRALVDSKSAELAVLKESAQRENSEKGMNLSNVKTLISELLATLNKRQEARAKTLQGTEEARSQWLLFCREKFHSENQSLQQDLLQMQDDLRRIRERFDGELAVLLDDLQGIRDPSANVDRDAYATAQRVVQHVLQTLSDYDRSPEYITSDPGDALDDAVISTITQLRFPFVIDLHKLPGSRGEYMIDRKVQLRLVNGEVMVKRMNGYETLSRYLMQVYAPLLGNDVVAALQLQQQQTQQHHQPPPQSLSVPPPQQQQHHTTSSSRNSSMPASLGIDDVVQPTTLPSSSSSTDRALMADIRELQVQHQRLQMELEEQQKLLVLARRQQQYNNSNPTSNPGVPSSTQKRLSPPPVREGYYSHSTADHHVVPPQQVPPPAASTTTTKLFNQQIQERQRAQVLALLEDVQQFGTTTTPSHNKSQQQQQTQPPHRMVSPKRPATPKSGTMAPSSIPQNITTPSAVVGDVRQVEMMKRQALQKQYKDMKKGGTTPSSSTGFTKK